LRLVFQSDAFLPAVIGGAEVFALHLLQALQRRGHQVLVLTSGSEAGGAARYDHEGIEIVKLDFQNVLLARDLAAYAGLCAEVGRIVADFGPDALLLSDTGRCGFFFLRRRAAGAVPRLLTLHSPIHPAERDTLQSQLMREADAIVAVSRSLCGDVVAAAPWARPKLSAIVNALPMPERTPDALPFTPPRLLFVGRLVVEKGADVAIRALAHARDQGLILDLVVAGDGPEKPALQALAQTLGLGRQIDFTGWTQPANVPALMNAATAVLVPSRWREPFGLVALQAAQMGRPVIASAVGGLPEIVQDGETGLLAPAGDAAALAQAVIRLVSAPDLARRLGRDARTRAEAVFGFDRLVDAYEAVILNIADAARRDRNLTGTR
jgi:glycosyltransferase involved in cell wall biosynthesis